MYRSSLYFHNFFFLYTLKNRNREKIFIFIKTEYSFFKNCTFLHPCKLRNKSFCSLKPVHLSFPKKKRNKEITKKKDRETLTFRIHGRDISWHKVVRAALYKRDMAVCRYFYYATRYFVVEKKKRKARQKSSREISRPPGCANNLAALIAEINFIRLFNAKWHYEAAMYRRLNTRYISFKAETWLPDTSSSLDAKGLISFARAFPYEFLLPSQRRP